MKIWTTKKNQSRKWPHHGRLWSRPRAYGPLLGRSSPKSIPRVTLKYFLGIFYKMSWSTKNQVRRYLTSYAIREFRVEDLIILIDQLVPFLVYFNKIIFNRQFRLILYLSTNIWGCIIIKVAIITTKILIAIKSNTYN